MIVPKILASPLSLESSTHKRDEGTSISKLLHSLASAKNEDNIRYLTGNTEYANSTNKLIVSDDTDDPLSDQIYTKVAVVLLCLGIVFAVIFTISNCMFEKNLREVLKKDKDREAGIIKNSGNLTQLK
jgi:hypothetical protein